jgi:hypothetical protein
MTPAPDLVRLWTQEALETERAIGQILQHLVQLYATTDVQRLALTQLHTEVERLRVIGESPVQPKPKKPPKPR